MLKRQGVRHETLCKLNVYKGQLISKAIYGLLTSPKKQTDLFALFGFLLFTANKSNSSVRLFGESTARQSAFQFYLTFNGAKLIKKNLVWGNERRKKPQIFRSIVSGSLKLFRQMSGCNNWCLWPRTTQIFWQKQISWFYTISWQMYPN